MGVSAVIVVFRTIHVIIEILFCHSYNGTECREYRFFDAFFPFLRKNFGSASARALMTLTKSIMALSSSFIVRRGVACSVG